VRHAGSEAIEQLEPFLVALRTVPGLVEKRPGIFYRRSRAFLHFHEDPSGLYADVRLEVDFERYRVTTRREQHTLLKKVRRAVQADR
jgi:hypothetical protein